MERVVFIAAILLFAHAASAQPKTSAVGKTTVQDRFAPKANSLYGHVVGATHLRNDFYTTYAVGVDAGYHFSESWGAELRAMFIESSLNGSAKDLKERTGLTPDARRQTGLLAAGLRWSIGYGKILAWKDIVLHFDPQLFLHGGVAFAEGRVLPTALYGVSLLNHFRWGIEVKVDLAGTFQLENRDTGLTPSFGLMPIIGVGWSWHP